MPNISWDALVDAAGEAGKAFEPLPDDNYNFVVSEASVGESKTGKKSIGITAIVESGPNAKRKVWNTWYISPENANALAYFFREMAVFGLPLEFWKSGPSDEAIINSLVNKRFVGTLKTVEYPENSGKKRNEFSGFAAPVGSPTGNAAATVGASTPSVPSTPTVTNAPSPSASPAPGIPGIPSVPQVPTANAAPSIDPWATHAPTAPGL